MFSDQEYDRYRRHITIPQIGEEGQAKLNQAKVLVVGAGGLGSPVAMYLAAAGVGTIGIVDNDTVECSNLQRQLLHSDATIGQPKVESAKTTLRNVNPFITVETHNVRLTASNAKSIVEPYDIVVDGSDNFPTRYLVSDVCELLDKPVVWGSVFRFEGQVSVFWASKGPTYRDLLPQPPSPDSVPTCEQAGVFGAICGIIGAAQAAETVKLITCIGKSLVGTVMIFDALDHSWLPVQLEKNPDRQPITDLKDFEWGCKPVFFQPKISAKELAEELKDVKILDVREKDEFRRGKIAGSVNLPLTQFDIDKVKFKKTDNIVVVCLSGSRSSGATRFLRKSGFENVRNLTGGLAAYARTVDSSLRL